MRIPSELKLLPAIIFSLACAACLAHSDPWATLGDDRTQRNGPFELHYILVSPLGPGFFYQTGSEAPTRTSEGLLETNPRIQAVSSESTTRVVGEGPSGAIEALVSDVAKGIATSARWLPESFNDGFEVTLQLEHDEAIDFRRRFIGARSPWPMAFAAHASRVRAPAGRVEFASKVSHEAYHLAQAVSRSGAYRPEFAARPDAGWIYEETAAHLVSACVQIELGQDVRLNRQPAIMIDLVDQETGGHDRSPPLWPAVIAELVNGTTRANYPRPAVIGLSIRQSSLSAAPCAERRSVLGSAPNTFSLFFTGGPPCTRRPWAGARPSPPAPLPAGRHTAGAPVTLRRLAHAKPQAPQRPWTAHHSPGWRSCRLSTRRDIQTAQRRSARTPLQLTGFGGL